MNDQPTDSPAEEPIGERRAPVVIGVLVAMALPILMPDRLSPGPRWWLPAMEGLLLAAMLFADPGRIDRRSTVVHRIRLALIGVLVVGAGWGVVRLTVDLVLGSPITKQATTLLASGALVWIGLVISFGFLFWELDAGGPGERAHRTGLPPDLAFPQQLSPDVARPGWRPVFVDYVYVALTGSLAFSPTDAMPLSHWAKAVLGVESVASVTLLGLVVARAVNILD